MPAHPRGLAQDCGPTLTPLFQDLLDGKPVALAAFEKASHDYFAATPHPNPYFNNLATIAIPWEGTRMYELGLLDIGLRVTHEWEARTGARVHKGTGYYFAGMRDVILGELDRGFLYMHQAMIEDELSSGKLMPNAPALAFVTLDSLKRNQAFGQEVRRYANLLQTRMRSYRRSGRGMLTAWALRQRVLAVPALIESSFQLTFVLARLTRLEQPDVGFARDNAFARTLFGQLAFDLCLIVDQALQHRQPTKWRFYELATFYVLTGGLSLPVSDLSGVSTLRGPAFSKTLDELLDGQYVANSGFRPVGIDADLLIAYAIRNHLAHGVAGDPILEERFEEIEKRLFYVYFSVIERLYP